MLPRQALQYSVATLWRPNKRIAPSRISPVNRPSRLLRAWRQVQRLVACCIRWIWNANEMSAALGRNRAFHQTNAARRRNRSVPIQILTYISIQGTIQLEGAVALWLRNRPPGTSSSGPCVHHAAPPTVGQIPCITHFDSTPGSPRVRWRASRLERSTEHPGRHFSFSGRSSWRRARVPCPDMSSTGP